MKKILTIAIAVVLTVAIAGAFSVNYIFDKILGNQALSQIDLKSLPVDLIDSIINSDLENEDKESKKNSDNKGKIEDSSGSKDSGKGAEITTVELKKIQDQLSTMDKLKITSMLTSKLSMEEIKELSSLASGGVDQDELNKIRKNLKEKLNENDIEYLKDLYEKYN